MITKIVLLLDYISWVLYINLSKIVYIYLFYQKNYLFWKYAFDCLIFKFKL